MTIDTAGLAAGRRALQQAAANSHPEAEHLVTNVRSRRRRQVLAGATVVVAVVIATVGVTSTRSPKSVTPAIPPGITPRHLTPSGLGFSVDVPASWVDTASLY